MSFYNDLELSIFGGRPIELFKFVHGADTWRYSASSKDVLAEYDPAVGEELYVKEIIKRSMIGQNTELAKSDLTISVPLSSEVSQLYLIGHPENVVSVIMLRQHDGAEGTMIGWRGRVVMAQWNNDMCDLTCQSVYSLQKITGLRRRYTRNCQHVVYSLRCGLDKEIYRVPGIITAISANKMVLTVSNMDDYVTNWATEDTFVAGMFSNFEGNVFRFITNQGRDETDGTLVTITLSTPITSVSVGDTVSFYPGCQHDMITCNDKFNNIANFGGFPWIPFENPFEGSIT